MRREILQQGLARGNRRKRRQPFRRFECSGLALAQQGRQHPARAFHARASIFHLLRRLLRRQRRLLHLEFGRASQFEAPANRGRQAFRELRERERLPAVPPRRPGPHRRGEPAPGSATLAPGFPLRKWRSPRERRRSRRPPLTENGKALIERREQLGFVRPDTDSQSGLGSAPAVVTPAFEISVAARKRREIRISVRGQAERLLKGETRIRRVGPRAGLGQKNRDGNREWGSDHGRTTRILPPAESRHVSRPIGTHHHTFAPGAVGTVSTGAHAPSGRSSATVKAPSDPPAAKTVPVRSSASMLSRPLAVRISLARCP